GRILLSGSANATNAALGRNGNVEACVVRIQREKAAAWAFSRSDPPDVRILAADQEENEPEIGILRAVLKGDQIAGQILSPVMNGEIVFSQVTAEGMSRIGISTLESNGRFNLRAPKLELQSWKGGRIVLQAKDADGHLSEGFISVAGFSE